jgi:hypothetical protein
MQSDGGDGMRTRGAENRKTTQLIDAAVGILTAESPMTIRQLFYRLVSKGLIPNDRKHYQLVSRVMTKARDDERCSFDHIVDRSRPAYSPNVWEDASGYAEAVKRGYRKDYWATQPNHVEIWVEKDAIIGSIEPTTDELGVTIRVGRGFLSTTKAHDIAERFTVIDKPITVFYLGDHDPSGQDIERDLYQRILSYDSGYFDLQRLAIHKEDISKFDLPPLRIKDGDMRAAKFRAQHGEECVELDALPPDELRRRVREAVEDLQDRELWKRAIAVETVELASIKDATRMWKTTVVDSREFGAVRDGV